MCFAVTRRRFLVMLAGTALGTPAYARYVEPRWLRLSHQRVPLPGPAGRRPIRLLHLSDFHVSDVVPLSFVRHAVEQGLATAPDVICLTGDYVTGRLRDEGTYRTLLGRLAGAAPTFACLGNHDGGAWVKYRGGYPDTTALRDFLASAGVTCLLNSSTMLELGGRPLRFVGLGDLWAEELQPERAFRQVKADPALSTVVIVHNPDSKDLLQPYPWDLLLCGHTHGGQMALPFVGTPFAPVRDRRFVDGLHAWEDRLLYITRGVGNLHGIRFNCRPEISLLTLM
jgi:predicted MPP superfamily phosphohydrolase